MVAVMVAEAGADMAEVVMAAVEDTEVMVVAVMEVVDMVVMEVDMVVMEADMAEVVTMVVTEVVAVVMVIGIILIITHLGIIILACGLAIILVGFVNRDVATLATALSDVPIRVTDRIVAFSRQIVKDAKNNLKGADAPLKPRPKAFAKLAELRYSVVEYTFGFTSCFALFSTKCSS